MKRDEQTQALYLLRQQSLFIEKVLNGEWTEEKAQGLGKALLAKVEKFVERYP